MLDPWYHIDPGLVLALPLPAKGPETQFSTSSCCSLGGNPDLIGLLRAVSVEADTP